MSCASCCIGTLTYVHPVGGREALVYARIDSVETLSDERASNGDRCLAQTIRATAPDLPHQYSPAALRDLMGMARRCADHPVP